MTNQEMNEKINQIINDFLFPLSEHENSKEELAAVSILLRGFVTCNNDSKDIENNPLLLTGVNPSFTGVYKSGEYIDSFTFKDATSKFWDKKKKQFGDKLCPKMAYLDLFPIRESDQNMFEQVFRNPNVKPENDKLTKLRADLLRVTQKVIEEMKPRLIVHANRQSMYYWGIKKNTPIDLDANDYENPWMGYKVKRVTPEAYAKLPECMQRYERWKLFPLYEIVGFVDSPNRINRSEYSETSLKGSFLMEYVMGYRKKEDQEKMYKDKDWQEIWGWDPNKSRE